MTNYTQTLFSSSSDEWNTPQSVFDELDREFHFTLDPCATAENTKCMKFYTKEQDGLENEWGGREYSVTRRIHKSINGWRSVTGNLSNQIQLWFC